MQSDNHENNSSDYRVNVRTKILKGLKEAGFTIVDGKTLFVSHEKEFVRKVHESSVRFLRERKREFIEKVDGDFIEKYIINGNELDIRNIKPKLVTVDDKRKSSLFNWIKLHWSIPISSGYGRRARYLVVDIGNSSVIGIIGLSDPVYGLRDRDNFIGWSIETKKTRLKHVMDAFVLGAVPPYSQILGGKLVASLITSTKISNDFCRKYKGKKTLISGEIFDGKLAAITTASALGKSSIYDRIKVEGGSQFHHIGWSRGSGEFQFYNGVYDDMFRIAHDHVLSSKNPKWGNGVRNRRTVIRTGLRILELPEELLYHNIKRELFFVPLGSKAREFLRGESKQIRYYNKSTADISEFALKRWVIPRSQRKKDYQKFRKQDYSLLHR